MADTVCRKLSFDTILGLRIWTSHYSGIVDQCIDLWNTVIVEDLLSTVAHAPEGVKVDWDEFCDDARVNFLDLVYHRLDLFYVSTKQDNHGRRSFCQSDGCFGTNAPPAGTCYEYYLCQQTTTSPCQSERRTSFALERSREGCNDIITRCFESELDHCRDIGLFRRGNIFGLPLTLLVEEGLVSYSSSQLYTGATVSTRHYFTICNSTDENHGLCGQIDAVPYWLTRRKPR